MRTVPLTRGQLLDVPEGRAGSAVSQWLGARDPKRIGAVEPVAFDPYQGYATRSSTASKRPRASSIPSASGDLRTRPSTTPAGGCSATRPATAAVVTTRCTASAGCCSPPASAFPSARTSGSTSALDRVIRAARCGKPGSLRKPSETSTPPAAGRSGPAPSPSCTPPLRPPRSASAAGWCAPSPTGKPRSWPTTATTASPPPRLGP